MIDCDLVLLMFFGVDHRVGVQSNAGCLLTSGHLAPQKLKELTA